MGLLVAHASSRPLTFPRSAPLSGDYENMLRLLGDHKGEALQRLWPSMGEDLLKMARVLHVSRRAQGGVHFPPALRSLRSCFGVSRYPGHTFLG